MSILPGSPSPLAVPQLGPRGTPSLNYPGLPSLRSLCTARQRIRALPRMQDPRPSVSSSNALGDT